AVEPVSLKLSDGAFTGYGFSQFLRAAAPMQDAILFGDLCVLLASLALARHAEIDDVAQIADLFLAKCVQRDDIGRLCGVAALIVVLWRFCGRLFAALLDMQWLDRYRRVISTVFVVDLIFDRRLDVKLQLEVDGR